MDFVSQRASWKAQLAEEDRRHDPRRSAQREGGDAERMPQLGPAALAQEILLFPDVAGRFDAAALVHVQRRLDRDWTTRNRGRTARFASARGDEFAAAEEKADLADLGGARARQMESSAARTVQEAASS